MIHFEDKKILIVGDVMLDSYFFGNVERISPEAPVPIVDVTIKDNKLGGAANVAANIKNLGGTPILCSIIGDDTNGEIIINILKKLKIGTTWIFKSKKRITTNKTRIIGNNHQMLRVDEEIKNELGEDNGIMQHMLYEIFNTEKIDCILFQDYDKGVINKEIIKYISDKAKISNIPILVDPKKNNFNFYNNIKLIKPNFKEFKDGLNLVGNKLDLLENGSKILHDKGIEIVFITLSENGIYVSYKNNKKEIINKIVPGIPRDVVDVSGAGDTVISVVAMLLNSMDIEQIAKISNLAGSIVCEEVGVVPINKDKLLKEYYEIIEKK